MIIQKLIEFFAIFNPIAFCVAVVMWVHLAIKLRREMHELHERLNQIEYDRIFKAVSND